MDQIKGRGYAGKHTGSGKTVHQAVFAFLGRERHRNALGKALTVSAGIPAPMSAPMSASYADIADIYETTASVTSPCPSRLPL